MKNKLKVKYFVPILLFSFMLVFLYGFSCSQNEASLLGETKDSPLKKQASTQKAYEVQDAFRGIYDLYKDRVVYISTEQTVRLQSNPFYNDPFFRQFFGTPNQRTPQTQKRQGLGSGFVISSDGYICTNYHVIQGVDKVTVKIEDKTYDATVVGSDETSDIALLKIKANDLKPAFLGDSDNVKVGDWSIAIGNPFGLDKTFTVGVISAQARNDAELLGSGSGSMLQTDASINPGNSGGPLININGEVIGINRMIYSQSGGSIGIGFAIPINTAKQVLEQLKLNKKVKRGYIGVQYVPLTEEYAQDLGLKENKGALVGAVVDNSPAEKAGLQVGDLIVMVNDKIIEKSGDLSDVVGKTPIGKTIKVQVIREKQKINLFVTIAEKP